MIIFVFGSNLAGRHGAGAAQYAKLHYGAIYGRGVGFQGSSWAIPTKDKMLKPLPVAEIANYVDMFLKDARRFSDKNYLVTRIGTGYAGHTDEEMAKLFIDAPSNCFFSSAWINHMRIVR